MFTYLVKTQSEEQGRNLYLYGILRNPGRIQWGSQQKYALRIQATQQYTARLVAQGVSCYLEYAATQSIKPRSVQLTESSCAYE